MKINININHIRIYKLLNFLPNKNIDFICKFLKMNRQNVILYIKQIYYLLETQNDDNSLNNIIKEISENKSIFYILKEKQIFMKNDRIFYIILILLKYYNLNLNLNLNVLTSSFNVSRRTLNDDLIEVKKYLKFYDLEITSISSKGISISGEIDQVNDCFLSYLFKFFIEFEELPSLMSKGYLNLLKEHIPLNLGNDLDYFIHTFDFDLFVNNKKLLKSLYIVYFNDSHTKKINSLSLEEFKKYFFDIFPQTNIEKIYSFFQSSSLGIFPLKNIDIFILTLKFCNGTLQETDIYLKKECDFIKDTFINITTRDISHEIFFVKFTHRISMANKKNSFHSLNDLSFLNLNLDYKIKYDCYRIFMELRKIYSNIQFSNIISLYLYDSSQTNLIDIPSAIVIYKNLPRFLQPAIKAAFLLKKNIQILNFIRYTELDCYILKNENYLFITFENLFIASNYSFIKYYTLAL